MLRRGTTLAAGVIVGCFLVAAAPAAASVTIGSDLAPDPTGVQCSSSSGCTLANLALPNGQVSSPIDGVVVSWAVRVEGPGGPARLRVLRPLGMGSFEGISSSVTRTLPAPGGIAATTIFSTQQAIKAGDIIGLDLDQSDANTVDIGTTSQAGVTAGRWQPALADGSNLSPITFPPPNPEYTFNATIEPDCDGDGLGDQTQDPDISSCTPDKTPPDTSIGKGPKKTIHATGKKTKVKFTFSSSETGATFKCKLDKKAFAACTSPKTYKVKPGKHSFQVEATDAAGNLDATPAKKKFKVLPAVQ